MSTPSFPPPAAPWPPPSVERSPRRLPPLSAAGWLATTGAVLLLTASIIVVAGNWQLIDPAIRFSGLVAALVAVYATAEAGRRRIPSTSRALATLAACLTAPVGVAAAATLHQPWPVCTLVAGAAALVATELQSRRWDAPALKVLTVVAFGLAAVGASALTSIPVTVIAAVGAALALTLGASRRAVALGLAVGISPLLVLLADLGIGTGTLPRIGADGADLTWSALLSCTVAAIVVGIVAHRQNNAPLAVAALATFIGGVLTSLFSGGAGAEVWWSVPAVALIAAESIAAKRSDSVWRTIARRVSPALAGGLGTMALALPYVSLVAQSNWTTEPLDGRWSVPFALTALALVAASFGSARRSGDRRWFVAALTAAGAAGFAMLVTMGLPLLPASICAVGAWLALATSTPRNLLDAPTAAWASWVTFGALIDNDVADNVRLLITIIGGVAVTAAIAASPRQDQGFRLIVAAFVTGGAVAMISEDTIGGGVLVTLALIAIGVAREPQQVTWPLAAAGALTYSAVADHIDHWPSVAMVMMLAAAFAGSSRDPRSVRLQVSAVLVVIAAALALAIRGTDPGTGAMAGSVVAIALTGIALVDRRCIALLAGATATAVLAVQASMFASPVFLSIAISILGLQLAVTGAIRGGRIAPLPGAALGVIGVSSFWWTTGTNAWAIEQIQPYGATGIDLAVAAIAALLFGIGSVVRQRQPVSSWLAFGPSLALVTTWLLASQVESNSDWATLSALVLGVATMAVGGRQRLGAPLMAGTTMVVGTLVVSAGPRLATAPTWAWIAVGGTGLLTLAALIERSDRPSERDEHDRSALDRFREDFR